MIAVGALSSGLDEAQNQVLDPLSGIGTDVIVSRPLSNSKGSGSDDFQPPARGSLSRAEAKRLRDENRDFAIEPSELGDPGERFSRDSFAVVRDLSFPQSEERKLQALPGVNAVAGSLTLNLIRSSGRVPEPSVIESFGRGRLSDPGQIKVRLRQFTVGGVDRRSDDLALISPSQVTRGKYLAPGGKARDEALVASGYARRQGIEVGDEVEVKGDDFKVVGLVEPPLGGDNADVYLALPVLQALSDRRGRVNKLLVRADDGADLPALTRQIRREIPGGRTLTSGDLAGNISGSLDDAAKLSDQVGRAIQALALIAAIALASLLVLTGVAKRTREFGTLKAIGWRSWLIVRQVTGEAVALGFIGGLFGVVLGCAVIAGFNSIAPGIESSSSAVLTPDAAQVPGASYFGLGKIPTVSKTTVLSAPLSAQLIVLAFGLALLAGGVAGALGGLRAARMRPAEALRRID